MSLIPHDDALARIEARLDRMEAVLERLSVVLDSGGAAIPMVVDTLDEAAARAAGRGVDVDQRLRAVELAIERITEPATLDALTRMASYADRLEPVARLAAGFEDNTAMLVDAADAWAAAAEARGVDVDERVRAAVGALERLSDPEVIETVQTLLGYAPLARAAAGYGHALPGYLAMAFDIADEMQSDALATGFDLEEALGSWMRVIRQLGELTATPALQSLLASPLLEPRTIKLTADIGEALARTLNEDPAPVGVWGVLSGLGDPKVQKASGFLLAWARHVGDALDVARRSS